VFGGRSADSVLTKPTVRAEEEGLRGRTSRERRTGTRDRRTQTRIRDKARRRNQGLGTGTRMDQKWITEVTEGQEGHEGLKKTEGSSEIEYKRFCEEERKRRKQRKWEEAPLYIQEIPPRH
jgi:hypothetical protein